MATETPERPWKGIAENFANELADELEWAGSGLVWPGIHFLTLKIERAIALEFDAVIEVAQIPPDAISAYKKAIATRMLSALPEGRR